jgi:hypothetical protein
MFGKKISFYECKDYFLTHIRAIKYNITADTPNCFSVSCVSGSRHIDVTIGNYKRNKVTIDIIDSFGLIRIPKQEAKTIEGFREFIVNDFTKIMSELN